MFSFYGNFFFKKSGKNQDLTQTALNPKKSVSETKGIKCKENNESQK